MIKKGLAVAVILLFIGVAFAPSINADVSKTKLDIVPDLNYDVDDRYDLDVEDRYYVNPLPDMNLGDIDTSFFSTYEIADFTSCAWGLTSADFNDDDLLDFAASYAMPSGFRISIFYNIGDLEFMQDEVYSFSYWHPSLSDLDSGDYDDDGDVDLLFTYSEYIWYGGLAVKVNGTGKILFNNGDNEFENEKQVFWHGPGIPYDPENRINPQITSADYDKDGDIDFLVGDNSGKVEFYKNDGVANFTGVGTIYDFGHVSWGLASADFDNDGWMDFIVAAEKNVGDKGHIYLKLNNQNSSCFDHTMGEIIADLPPQVGPLSINRKTPFL